MENKNKKWQNLIYKKCPVCGEDLRECKDLTVLYECTGGKCWFVISRRKYADILTDKDHILRRFLTPKEISFLEKKINEVMAWT